jgi:hypothetical protein
MVKHVDKDYKDVAFVSVLSNGEVIEKAKRMAMQTREARQLMSSLAVTTSTTTVTTSTSTTIINPLEPLKLLIEYNQVGFPIMILDRTLVELKRIIRAYYTLPDSFIIKLSNGTIVVNDVHVKQLQEYEMLQVCCE